MSEYRDGGNGQKNSVEPGNELDTDASADASVEPSYLDLRPRAAAALIELAFFAGLGLGLGALCSLGLAKMGWHSYGYPNLHYWAVLLLAVAGGLAPLKRMIPRVLTSYRLTDRHIRSKLFLLVYTKADTIDMTQVKDVTMSELGPLSSISVISSDKSHPEFTVGYLSVGQARRGYEFINRYAIGNYVEYRSERDKKNS